MDRDVQVTKAVTRLGVVLDAQLTPLRITGYVEALADVPLNSLLWACREAEKTCEYMPRPVQLRYLAGKCPPVKNIGSTYNSQQIAEFTQTQVEEAKRKLKDLASGIFGEVAT